MSKIVQVRYTKNVADNQDNICVVRCQKNEAHQISVYVSNDGYNFEWDSDHNVKNVHVVRALVKKLADDEDDVIDDQLN